MRIWSFIFILIIFPTISNAANYDQVYGIGVLYEPVSLNIRGLLKDRYGTLDSTSVDAINMTQKEYGIHYGRRYQKFHILLGAFLSIENYSEPFSFISNGNSLTLKNLEYHGSSYILEVGYFTAGAKVNTFKLTVADNGTSTENTFSTYEIELHVGINFGHLLTTKYLVPHIRYSYNINQGITERNNLVGGLTIIF